VSCILYRHSYCTWRTYSISTLVYIDTRIVPGGHILYRHSYCTWRICICEVSNSKSIRFKKYLLDCRYSYRIPTLVFDICILYRHSYCTWRTCICEVSNSKSIRIGYRHSYSIFVLYTDTRMIPGGHVSVKCPIQKVFVRFLTILIRF